MTKEWTMLSHRLLPLLFVSFIFCGELEVDGNLNVSGTIQSQTIDSLLQVIAELQAQIALLQGGAENRLETRVYALPRFNFSGITSEEFYLSDIIGNSLDYSIVTIVYVSDYQTSVGSSTGIQIQREYETSNGDTWYHGIDIRLQGGGALGVEYSSNHLIVIGGEKLRFFKIMIVMHIQDMLICIFLSQPNSLIKTSYLFTVRYITLNLLNLSKMQEIE